MSPKMIAVLLAALALPFAARSAVPAAESRPVMQVQQDKAKDVAKADAKVTPKERARLAKAQNKQTRKVAKQKQDTQKKPPAG